MSVDSWTELPTDKLHVSPSCDEAGDRVRGRGRAGTSLSRRSRNTRARASRARSCAAIPSCAAVRGARGRRVVGRLGAVIQTARRRSGDTTRRLGRIRNPRQGRSATRGRDGAGGSSRPDPILGITSTYSMARNNPGRADQPLPGVTLNSTREMSVLRPSLPTGRREPKLHTGRDSAVRRSSEDPGTAQITL
jgi:hypothetical protein